MKILEANTIIIFRYKRKMRPFGVRATKNPIEIILSDGFYAVFHQRWIDYFPPEQLLVIDGSQFRKSCIFVR